MNFANFANKIYEWCKKRSQKREGLNTTRVMTPPDLQDKSIIEVRPTEFWAWT